MSRDWSKVKKSATETIGSTLYHGHATCLLEAMAEIEQLRQEKAELVELVKDTAQSIKEIAEEDNFYYWMVNGQYRKLTEHLAKLEGGEPNAKP